VRSLTLLAKPGESLGIHRNGHLLGYRLLFPHSQRALVSAASTRNIICFVTTSCALKSRLSPPCRDSTAPDNRLWELPQLSAADA
jgi:hypothetical protein